MEKHVPDLEKCKKLKEAGWEKRTKFIYNSLGHLIYFPEEGAAILSSDLPAPLLSELLEELPEATHLDHYDFYYINLDDPRLYVEGMIKDKNPCNAAADLWLWMTKRKEVVKDVK